MGTEGQATQETAGRSFLQSPAPRGMPPPWTSLRPSPRASAPFTEYRSNRVANRTDRNDSAGRCAPHDSCTAGR
eukprot:8120180-Alexandrium_andersonii.AAC.1